MGKNCGSHPNIAENCGKLRKLGKIAEIAGNCGKIADRNPSLLVRQFLQDPFCPASDLVFRGAYVSKGGRGVLWGGESIPLQWLSNIELRNFLNAFDT